MSSMQDLRNLTSGGKSLKEENIEKLKQLEEQRKQQAQQYMDAAIQRAEEAEKAAAEESANKKSAFDESQEAWGHEHHEVIVNGVNLSDSLHRRRQTANRNVEMCQKYLEEQEMKRELGENETTVQEQVNEQVTTEPVVSENNNSNFSLTGNPTQEYIDPEEAAIEAEIEKEIGGRNMNNQDEVIINARPGSIPVSRNNTTSVPQTQQTETIPTAAQYGAMDINQLNSTGQINPEDVHKEIPKPKNVGISVEGEENNLETENDSEIMKEQHKIVEEPITNTTHVIEESIEEEASNSQDSNNVDQTNITFMPSMKESVAPEAKKASDINFNVDEEDDNIAKEAEQDLVEMSEEELNQALKKVQEDIAVKLGLRGREDLSNAQVSNQPVTLTNVLNIFNQQSASINKSADWVLVSAGKLFTMKEWTGPELDSINKDTSGRNRFNTLREIFFAIYSHIISEKPAFEEWLKTTSFFDIDHLYMGIYAANYANGKNFLPYNCEDAKCRFPFLSEHHPMDDMMYFTDDEAKERFYKIKESTDTVKPIYEPKIEQIYAQIGMEFKEPSIYDVVFEPAVLDDAFSQKYADIIRFMVYVKNIYLYVNGEWHPIQCPVYPDNIVKTTKTRIITFAKVFAQLPSDAMKYVDKFTDQIDSAGNKVKYRLPEEVCPRCGKPVARNINDTIFDASRLVFSRHQLTRI